MFPFTHIYCAKQIVANPGPRFLYGAIFPDIPMTKIVPWSTMKSRTIEFAETIRRQQPALADIADGMLIHEEPQGIDRFVHGENGYAYIHGRSIESHLVPFFPTGTSDVAHSFIEYAVETLVVRRHPELLADASAVLSSAQADMAIIAAVFARTFQTEPEQTATALGDFHRWFAEMDFSSDVATVAYYTRLTNVLRGSSMSDEQVRQILVAATAEVKPNYEAALASMIERCIADRA